MSSVDIILLVMIGLFFVFCLYDNHFSDYFNGKTYARIELKREGRLDGTIFIALIVILLYKNIELQGTGLTSYLLGSLILVSIYSFFIRCPKFLIKPMGFVYLNILVDYRRIQKMTLSDEGILFIALEKKVLAIKVNQINDLGTIYEQLKPLYLSRTQSHLDDEL